MIIPLSETTDDALILTQEMISGLKRIYCPGYAYAKAGIMLAVIVQNNQAPVNLFTDIDARTRCGDLNNTMDEINPHYGKNTEYPMITVFAENSWSMNRGNKPVGYTTNWNELPIVIG